ncbi:MAG: C39 family peptidase [Ardenticatenaceae bacterium]|nr:C39 family peptidase [Ardenticatenaceae bacterium]
MGKQLLVPHFQQKANGYCLPACVQMVWGYWGVVASQDEIAKLLGMRHYFGIPMSQIKRLETSGLTVVFDQGTARELENWLNRGVPVVVFLQAGELPYWQGEIFQHAVVAVGMDEQFIWLLDPALTDSNSVSTPLDDFMLAWGEMDYSFAVLNRR